MDQLDVRLSGLLDAAALLDGGVRQSAPLRGTPPMPLGPAPTIAPDANSTLAWWVERLAAHVRHVEDAAQSLRANAEGYAVVDRGVAERFTVEPPTAGGGNDPTPPPGMRAL